MKKRFIDRDVALSMLKSRLLASEYYVESAVSDIPDADVKPVVRGHWIAKPEGARFPYYECSECGDISYAYAKYCLNCGADMSQGQWKRCYEGIGWDCPKCGSHSESQTKYCSNCGERLMNQ